MPAVLAWGWGDEAGHSHDRHAARTAWAGQACLDFGHGAVEVALSAPEHDLASPSRTGAAVLAAKADLPTTL